MATGLRGYCISAIFNLAVLNLRVATSPGKFWISFKISRPWKVLENGFGSGKFSKL